MAKGIFDNPMTFEQLADYMQDMYQRFFPYVVDGIKNKSQSPIEGIAGLALYVLNEEFGHKNIHIEQQKQIGKYRVDFEVIYKPFYFRNGEEPMAKIVIECDGHEFHEKTKEQASRDKERDRELQKLGYTVLRYSGSDLYRNWRTLRDDVSEIIDPYEKQDIEEWIAQQKAEGEI